MNFRKVLLFNQAVGFDDAHGVGPQVRRRSRLCVSKVTQVKVSEYRRKNNFRKVPFFSNEVAGFVISFKKGRK